MFNYKYYNNYNYIYIHAYYTHSHCKENFIFSNTLWILGVLEHHS